MQKKSAQPRRKAARVPLNRELIVDSALQLIDAEGLEGFSMRRLGAALGVEAMALYHHFSSKGQLLDAVMERLLDEAELLPHGAVAPLERLRRFLTSYRQIAVRHPHAFILLSYRRFNTERTFSLYEQILEILAELGLDPPLAARFFRLVGYYVNGAGMADIASRAQQPDATPIQLENFVDAAHYPRVAAVAPHVRLANLDTIFEFGLEAILETLRMTAAEAARSRGS